MKDAFPIPNIEDLVYQLNLMIIATTFDLAESYNQVLVKEEDKPKTAFATDCGLMPCDVLRLDKCSSDIPTAHDDDTRKRNR